MEIIKNRDTNSKFSLHDAIINNIEIIDNGVKFCFDYIFDYSNDEESTCKADMVFTEMDATVDCNVYIFDDIVEQGFTKSKKFSGKIYNLKDFLNTYKKFYIEIITESYYGYESIFRGWLYQDDSSVAVSCIVTLWNDGDIIYEI